MTRAPATPPTRTAAPAMLSFVPLLALLLAACAGGPSLGPRATHLPPDEVAQLPSRFTRGVFLVTAMLGDHPNGYLMLLDTGTDRTLIDLSLAPALGLRAESDEAVVTATGAAVAGFRLQRLPSLRLGEVRFEEVDVVGVDLSALREHGGLPIAGIVGCDLFRQSLLELDYHFRTVRVLPLHAAPESGAHTFDQRSPWITVEAAGRPLRVLVDTGFQQTLALPPETVLPWRRPPRAGGRIATIEGTHEKLLARLRGDLRLGDLRWRDPWIVLAEGSPKLGARLLRGCRLLLDASGGRLWISRSLE